MKVTGFDHLVLDVADVERSIAYYTGPLGLEPVGLAEWRAGDAPFPSVRVSESTIIDLISTGDAGDTGDARRPNVDHFCLVVEPLDWQQVIADGGLDVVEGPGTRSGARGTAESIYVHDPDGNTIELRWYPQDAQA